MQILHLVSIGKCSSDNNILVKTFSKLMNDMVFFLSLSLDKKTATDGNMNVHKFQPLHLCVCWIS